MPTRIIGERFYIYASKTPDRPERFAELSVEPGDLPTGVIVGTVEIRRCTPAERGYCWELARPKRLKKPRKPRNRPQPVWFHPFGCSRRDTRLIRMLARGARMLILGAPSPFPDLLKAWRLGIHVPRHVRVVLEQHVDAVLAAGRFICHRPTA